MPTPSGICALFLSCLLARCDEPCPATQQAIDLMVEANYRDRATMLEHLGRISSLDLCDAIMVAWARVPLKLATGRSRDEWLVFFSTPRAA